jgi:hypothetical protein
MSAIALIPSAPILPEFRVQAFYRVVSWSFFTQAWQWHRMLNLHAHLACPIFRRWVRGGFHRDHARSGHTGPPRPASATVEYHVPVDVPQSLRCNLCWGPALWKIPGPFWRPPLWYVDSPLDLTWPYSRAGSFTGGTHATSRWFSQQFRLYEPVWDHKYGGIYEREIVVLEKAA